MSVLEIIIYSLLGTGLIAYITISIIKAKIKKEKLENDNENKRDARDMQ